MRITLLDGNAMHRRQLFNALNITEIEYQGFSRPSDLLSTLCVSKSDLYVLAWELTEMTTLEVLRRIRVQNSRVAILVMSERYVEEDLVEALANGADDYRSKPWRSDELVARMRVLVRRSKPLPLCERDLVVGPFRVDLQTHEICKDGRLVALTQMEYRLALYFLRHLDTTLTRATLSRAVWARADPITTRTMDTHVSRVRIKLGLQGQRGFLLAPVYGVGYGLYRRFATSLNRDGHAPGADRSAADAVR